MSENDWIVLFGISVSLESLLYLSHVQEINRRTLSHWGPEKENGSRWKVSWVLGCIFNIWEMQILCFYLRSQCLIGKEDNGTLFFCALKCHYLYKFLELQHTLTIHRQTSLKFIASLIYSDSVIKIQVARYTFCVENLNTMSWNCLLCLASEDKA